MHSFHYSVELASAEFSASNEHNALLVYDQGWTARTDPSRGDPSDIVELGSCLCGRSLHTELPPVRGPRTKSIQCYVDLRAAKVLDNGLIHKLASEMNRLDSFSLYDEVPEESITAFYGKEDDTASEATVSDCLFNESDKEEAGSDAATSAPQTTSSEEVLLIDAPEDKVDEDWSAFGF